MICIKQRYDQLYKLRRRMYQSIIIFWLSFIIIFIQSLLFFIQINTNISIQCGHLYTTQYLNYQLLLIPMSTDLKSILIRAYECKIRAKVNIQEFLDIVNSDFTLEKISQKGLLILYLSEILLKAYIAQGLKIRNFISQFDKKEVKKRQKREGGGERRRRRKTKNQNKRGQGRTLQQISNQSLSNPSNVQRPRINAQNNRVDQSGNQILPSREKEQDSNKSGSKDSKNQLKIQLNKITQQIRGQEETYLTDPQFAPATQFEQNSQSQSSSQNTGQISNLSQKIKIFTNIKSNQRRGTTTRRKTGNNNATRDTRTKKKKLDIIDQSTFIEETRATDNQITINYSQISRFDHEDSFDMDMLSNFIASLGKQQRTSTLQIFKKDKLDQLKYILNSSLPPHPEDTTHNYGMMPINEDTDIQFPDYTMSQPTSAPLFQPDFFKQSLQLKESQFTFKDLLNHSKKDKATLLYQLLWRQQNDEIRLSQDRPQIFSMIKVRHK